MLCSMTGSWCPFTVTQPNSWPKLFAAACVLVTLCNRSVFRGTEVVESTVRQHIGACFSALEQRVLSTLSEATQKMGSGPNAASAPAQDKPLLQVCVSLPVFHLTPYCAFPLHIDFLALLSSA